MTPKELRPYVSEELIGTIQNKFSETEGMTVTGVVNWALRYLLKIQEAEYMTKQKVEA